MTRNVEDIFGGTATAPKQVLEKYQALGGETTLTTSRGFQSIVIAIDGAVQTPGEAYTIDGQNITLAQPLNSNSEVIMLLDVAFSPRESLGEFVQNISFKSTTNQVSYKPSFSYSSVIFFYDNKPWIPDVDFKVEDDGNITFTTPMAEGKQVYIVFGGYRGQALIGTPEKRSNIQAIARDFRVREGQVLYSEAGKLLAGYKVIYDQVAQKAYSLPSAIPTNATITSFSNGILVASGVSFDLGKLAINRREFNELQEDFSTGFVLNAANDIVTDGSYWYRWGGSFPKNVSSNSDVTSSGGLGDQAWVRLFGSSSVPYTNPFSKAEETVKAALDKIMVRTIYASDFGVLGLGGDESNALYNLGKAISEATQPLRVVFPKVTSLVGSQEFAGATGKGFSYRPTYMQRDWGDLSRAGWFPIYNTNQEITLDMSGWTLKMNSGMKIGSFDPSTGNVYNPPSLPFRDYDYQASQGYLVKIFKAPNVTVIRGKTDGNIPGVVWGGKFGDTGYQVPAYNWWVNQSSGIEVYDHVFQSSPLDCLYVGENSEGFSPGETTQLKGSLFKRCMFQDGGRNILSFTGGANAVFEDCEYWRAGNNANGITGHGSGPASCIDVEAEGGKILNLLFRNCKMMHGGDVAVVGGYATPYDITGVVFEKCIMHCETGDYAFINYARNCKLVDCVFFGGASLDTGAKQDATKLIRCKFYNTVDGKFLTKFNISGICDLMEDCEVDIQIPTTALPDLTIFNLRGYQQLPGGYGNRARITNLLVHLSGKSENVTHQDLGSLSFYRGITAHIDAAGLTGSKVLALYCRDSTAGFEGLTVGGSANVNFGGSMDNQPGTGIYYDKTIPVAAGGTLMPTLDSIQQLGARGHSFKHAWFANGWMSYSPDGTSYKISVQNGGTITAVPDNTTN